MILLMYTLIRILWEHNAQNVVVDIPILSLIMNFTDRGNSGCKQIPKLGIFVTSWSVTYRIYRIIAKYATSNFAVMDFVCFILTSYFALCLQNTGETKWRQEKTGVSKTRRRYIKVIYGWRRYIKMIYRRWGMTGSRIQYSIWFLLANHIPRILPEVG